MLRWPRKPGRPAIDTARISTLRMRGFSADCSSVSHSSCQVPRVARSGGINHRLSLCLRRPGRGPAVRLRNLSRKEVVQPHLPVRLPCYDLAPVTCFTLGRSLRSRTSGTPGFHGLTGGVYKARERIHRIMADIRLLANPTSRSRVADSDPNWDRLLRLASCHQVAPLCTGHCNTCVALDIRAVLI